MGNGNFIVVWIALLAAGVLGAFVAIWAIRRRRAVWMVVGALLVILCHGMVVLQYWAQSVAWAQRLVMATGGVALPSVLNPIDVQRRLQRGTFSDADFDLLVSDVTHAGGNKSSYRSLLANWLLSGAINERFAGRLVDTLIRDWPTWNPRQNAIDELANAVMESPVVPRDKRTTFAQMMVAAIGDGTAPSKEWGDVLTRAMIEGTLDDKVRDDWLRVLASPRMEVVPPGSIPAGGVFQVKFSGLPGRQSMYTPWPWEAGIEMIGGDVSVLRAPEIADANFGPVCAVLRAPQTPGRYELTASTTVALRRDAVYELCSLNPQFLSPRMRLDRMPDLHGTGRVVITIDVKEQGSGSVEQVRNVLSNEIQLEAQGALVKMPDGLLVKLTLCIKPTNLSMAFDAFLIGNGREYPLGMVVGLEGQKTACTMTAKHVKERITEGRIRLVPRPQVLGTTQGVTKVYAGEPLEVSVYLFSRGDD